MGVEKINEERKALMIGLGLNVFSAVIGILFYLWTSSISIFMDGVISLVLSISTFASMVVVSKRKRKKDSDYPFGRYPLETIFVIMRTVLMMGILIYTAYEASITILRWKEGVSPDLNLNLVLLISYAMLMTGATVLIYVVYSRAYKKGGCKSPILKVEMVSAVFDALVTLVAITSLIVFKYIPFLEPVSEIGDSITAIILSLFYFYEPVKIFLSQFKVLVGKRTLKEEEKKLREKLSSSFEEIRFYDVYIQDYGSSKSLFVTFYPRDEENVGEVGVFMEDILSFVKKDYPGSPIYLSPVAKMLHEH